MEIRQNQEKLDTLLREANVLRLRGQLAEAEARCRAALEMARGGDALLNVRADRSDNKYM